MRKTIGLTIAALAAALLPAPPAYAAPSIEFVNPSDYSPTIRISDKPDRDNAVHLVAWVKEVPATPVVEFEIRALNQNANTVDAVRVGADTWEGSLVLPDATTDGAQYTLTARLYTGSGGNFDELDNDEMIVEVNQADVPPPPASETIEMSYPDNGDRLGFFVPKGKNPNAIFDYQASVDTNRARALYTTSAVGTDPEWESCGASAPDDQGFGRVRCTLNDGDGPSAVTAVAVVSNKTLPPAPPNANLDDTGDAHRVVPYLQDPANVEISPGSPTFDLAKCILLAATVTDQFDRPVGAANVDVHASGPEDALTFGSITGNEDDRLNTDTFQNPDSGHVSRENAKRCSDNTNLGNQGEHNNPQGDDIKHIESVDGTDDNGTFRFAIRSDFAGGTNVQAWADETEDDNAALNEAVGGGQIGWGGPPPPPTEEIFLTPSSTNGSTGSCVQFTAVARRGGNPFGGANVDVHLAGPDASVNFCDVSGGSPRRAPESGGHVADAHEDGTRHGEGEADSTGQFVFGLTSTSPGTTNVQVWLDSNDDDVASGEPTRSGTVTWAPPGERTISIASNKSSVRAGRRVVLSGSIQGDPACAGAQAVNIQSKPVRGGRFTTVKVVTTDDEGGYATRIKIRSSRKFRAVAPTSGACDQARSNTITVRARG